MALELDEIITLCEEIGCEYAVNEPMSAHTSFKIGGPADIFVSPSSSEQLIRLLPGATGLSLPVNIIGRGSDLLVSDEGIRGIVIALGGKMSGMRVTGEGEIECEAGATVDSLCQFALKNSLTGLEFAYGIPGSVGGAVYMNAGAYGGEFRDVLTSAKHLDFTGKWGRFTDGELLLSYRHSAYTERSDLCIISAKLKLSSGDPAAIKAKMDDLRQRRHDKQPLEYPSGGSTFKRPVGGYASELIDRCGLKGLRVGGAMVSEKHAGFLINYDNATCGDMLALIKRVREIVLEKTGFTLECEVKILC